MSCMVMKYLNLSFVFTFASTLKITYRGNFYGCNPLSLHYKDTGFESRINGQLVFLKVSFPWYIQRRNFLNV
jgi:hypothetical protein